MVKEITISKIFVNREGKDGKPYRSPLINLYFNSPDGKEHKASSFVQESSPAIDWQVGDKVELEFYKKGEYLNFKAPSLESRVVALEEKVFGKKPPADNPNATEKEKEDDLSFLD